MSVRNYHYSLRNNPEVRSSHLLRGGKPEIMQANCVKKTQLDEQLILIIFRQPLHILGVSRPIIRKYNRLCTTIGTYYSNNPTRTTHSHLKRIKYQLLYTFGCTS